MTNCEFHHENKNQFWKTDFSENLLLESLYTPYLDNLLSFDKKASESLNIWESGVGGLMNALEDTEVNIEINEREG